MSLKTSAHAHVFYAFTFQTARLRASQQLVADLLEDQKTHGRPQEGGSSSSSDQQQLPKHKQLEHALRRCSPIMVCSNRAN
eukprot:1160528-Pelagomonas_calceolata.AAC.2